MGYMKDTIAKLRKLLAEATPGPWHTTCDSVGYEEEHLIYFVASGSPLLGHKPKMEHLTSVIDEADSDLIVAAVNALPGLLTEIERLQEIEWMYKELCK